MRFMKTVKAGTIGVSGLGLLATDAAAQQMETPFRLPDITLPGIEQSAQRAAQIKRDAPNATEVIDSEQLSQFNEQALGDALRRLPGITFDGANRAREIRLRGLPGEYTQVLINGRPLIDGESRRNFEVDRLPTSLVDRVEIIRSPRASLEGSGAAGTVNIVLKTGADLPSGSEVSIGADHMEDNGELGELTVIHRGRTGALRYTLAGSVQQFRRNESKTELSFDGLGARDGGERRLNERRFEQVNLTPGFTWDLGSGGELTIEPYYFYTKEFRDDVRRSLATDQATVIDSRKEKRERTREAYGLRAAWSVDLSGGANLRFGIDWQEGTTDTVRNERRFDAAQAVTRVTRRTEEIDLQMIRPEAVLSWQSGGHDLSFGVGARLQEHKETNAEFRNGAPRPPERTASSILTRISTSPSSRMSGPFRTG